MTAKQIERKIEIAKAVKLKAANIVVEKNTEIKTLNDDLKAAKAAEKTKVVSAKKTTKKPVAKKTTKVVGTAKAASDSEI